MRLGISGRLATVLIAAWLSFPTAWAATNLVVNGGFESPSVLGSGIQTFSASGSFPGWTVEFGAIDIHDSSWFASAEGLQCVDLNALDSGGIYQDLVTTPGQPYDLRFAFGANTVRIGNPETMPLVKVMEVLWGNTLLATLFLDVTGLSPSNPGWREHAYRVIGTGTDRITFRSLSGGHAGPAVDAVSLSPASTRTVVNLNDSGPGSLRQAIADAAPGDTINFAVTGTITLTSGELVVDKDLTISGPGATSLAVSGNNASRVFFFDHTTANLSGLTVAAGRADMGGGIRNAWSTLNVRDCAVAGNYAYSTGGGIFNNAGELTVLRSIVSANSANNSGGGIDMWHGTVTILDSSIVGNISGDGGGMNIVGLLLMTNCTVSGNSGRTGGGICAQLENWIVNSTITSNSASRSGGGIFLLDYDDSDRVMLQNTIVAGNSAPAAPDLRSPLSPFHPIISLDYNLIQNSQQPPAKPEACKL
ncbi:MAG TPA: DUF642 domain-containing protein [Verrucomicrobiae bacterium]